MNSLALDESDERALRGFQFLSQKPLMVVINCSEDVMTDRKIAEEVNGRLPDGTPCLPRVQHEAELTAMEPADRSAFMEEYGVKESLQVTAISFTYGPWASYLF